MKQLIALLIIASAILVACTEDKSEVRERGGDVVTEVRTGLQLLTVVKDDNYYIFGGIDTAVTVLPTLEAAMQEVGRVSNEDAMKLERHLKLNVIELGDSILFVNDSLYEGLGFRKLP